MKKQTKITAELKNNRLEINGVCVAWVEQRYETYNYNSLRHVYYYIRDGAIDASRPFVKKETALRNMCKRFGFKMEDLI
jgi:hypothetical protein